MDKCNFCGKEIEPGTGVQFIKKDSKIFNFCSRRCEKNMLELKRKPRRTKWTEEYKKEKAVRVAAMKK
ncbi:50S ribosomal protein L24e [Candidatus Woesearchaeota archaeon]|jgi:large subunit ribosomal protein L24e|nr:50S ribosomal protein L24e [Candidatus Woesearchaeota archaeon]MBT4388005.1 50S ribosomal protein L24e [Candidatus Woesearchaeota archaeon]MBT4595349.1 50S ribosomal protein L24e [Candidatus Woesearchaeota archaeon]MBT5741246.1 50S ribosomal protein L24e [Candidatus Woesearchaeota archaeon]MBT6505858.1 50S ribosomal protein L24e [Candidatus Woesearchaeota archaeon]